MPRLKLHGAGQDSEGERLGVRMAANETLELLIYDVIGEDWYGEGVTAKQVAQALKDNADARAIMVRINSPGGNVFDATAIYNLLSQHKAHVTVEIDGAALSAASVVAMAGDTIRMAENALMMIHDPYAFAVGTADELRGSATMLDKVKDTIVATYSARSGTAPKKVAELMSATTWLTAAEAREMGLADEIIEAKKVAACAGAGAALVYRTLRNSAPDWARRRLDAWDQPEPAVVTPPMAVKEVAMSDNKPEAGAANAATAQTANQAAVVTAATLDELRRALPHADNDFLIDCLDHKRTTEQARNTWIEALERRIADGKAEQERLAAENKTLHAQVYQSEAEKRGGSGPGTGQAIDKAPEEAGEPAGDDPQSWERAWDKNTNGVRTTFNDDKPAYLAYMRARINGQVREFRPAGAA
jgi:ATP-dependent Clp protease protease subunit